MKQYQKQLDLIPHAVNGSIIEQRTKDGYINATALCKAAGKQWGEYNANKATKAFLDVVAAKTGIPVLELIQVVISAGVRSTWVHPKIATHLGQWLSPEFAYQVAEWVEDWLSGSGETIKVNPSGSKLPPHIRRYLLNQPAVPSGHFTVLQEITFILTGPLEAAGYELAEEFLPDGSLGRMFCAYLRDKHGYDTNALPKYTHRFEDGRKVSANAYPVELLGSFRRYATEIWLPNRAPRYFLDRDPAALPYLNRLPSLQQRPAAAR